MGAGSPTFGIGASSFAGGDLNDWSSLVNICPNVGGVILEEAEEEGGKEGL